MDHELVADLYRKMLQIRRFEEEAARLYTEKKIGGFLHLYIGQEAVAVGTISVLNENDPIMTSYRCHGLYLARGGSPRAGMAELLGRETGCAQGRGGSMHFYDVDKSFYGGWGIVGAQMPVAAGFAFASKYNNEDKAIVCFLGDGAINIGPFHEACCLASIWNLPVIYVIENNHFAMGTPIEKTSATDDLSIRALGYPIARETVDGHDIFAVRSAMHSAVKRAREKKLPTILEMKTYRYRGHSMSDPGLYRTKDEVQSWKERDPISVLAGKMNELGLGDLKTKIDNEIEAEIADAVQFAENSNYPDPATATNYSYTHYNY